ncbi:MAG: HTTM domain-containing protein [Proteobacteria bacterium]|nr:HTTM domain-containing protein [Pseudomonadota bacterium]
MAKRKAKPTSPAPLAEPSQEESVSLWERFWSHPFSATRIALFRFFFFACVAFESFRDLEHAPRYGAGGFNVPHFDWLIALPVPSRYAMVVLFLAQFALALRVAFGLGGRITVWALTAVYGYTYFISQLDSYQHHYMVFLFLVLMSLVDWESERPRTWPIQLVVVEVAIVYFWAGVTKVQPLWIDGTLLRMQVGGGEFHKTVESTAGSLGISVDTAYALMADYSMLMEFAVPAVLLITPLMRPSRGRDALLWLGCIWGLGMHVGIEFAGLKIGLFSYMMMAFYLLVIPEGPIRFASRVGDTALEGVRAGLVKLDASGLRDGVFGVALAFTAWTVWQLPLEYSGAAAVLITGVALVSEWPIRAGRGQRALGHLLVGLTVLYAAASGDTMRQYWYYLGGDARRRGDIALATYAYKNTAVVDPGYASAYMRHAQMLERAHRLEEAREVYETGLKLAEPTFELYQGLALVCDRMGEGPCAWDAADKAVVLKPDPRMQSIQRKRH